jgi:hypothetical protein
MTHPYLARHPQIASANGNSNTVLEFFKTLPHAWYHYRDVHNALAAMLPDRFTHDPACLRMSFLPGYVSSTLGGNKVWHATPHPNRTRLGKGFYRTHGAGSLPWNAFGDASLEVTGVRWEDSAHFHDRVGREGDHTLLWRQTREWARQIMVPKASVPPEPVEEPQAKVVAVEPEKELEPLSVEEGKKRLKSHYERERSPALKKRAIELFKKAHRGRISCEACRCRFSSKYGPRGENVIEVHHTVPIRDLDGRRSRVEDLVLLCANCHRVVHAKEPWLTKDELTDLMKNQRDSMKKEKPRGRLEST